jgi:hypothetical protein
VKQFRRRFVEVFEIFQPQCDVETFKIKLDDRLKQFEEYKDVHQVMLYLSGFLKNVSEEIGISIFKL